MECLDFEPHAITFGALHFADLDMGESAKLNTRAQCAIGSENPCGSNQYAQKHLAMGLEWLGSRKVGGYHQGGGWIS